MKIISGIIESLFPIYCFSCGSRGDYLCKNCSKDLPPSSSPEFDWARSIFAYHDPRIRFLIRSLKFKNHKKVAQFFAPYIKEALFEFIGEEKHFLSGNIIIIPIPLSRERMKMRGYNQAEILIKETLNKFPIESIQLRNNILKKVRETIPQTSMKKRSERLKNAQDCFSVSVKSEDLSNTVIIFDDVTTTGATLVSARNILRKNGFKKVYALTLAH